MSQRLTDTLLKALGLSACSQGTMEVEPGDRLVLETPGGGGWEAPGE